MKRRSIPLGPAALLGLLVIGCAGSDRRTGDRAGTENQVMTVSPTQTSLAPGQSTTFSATIPWGGNAIWSVVPATGGVFTKGGTFTAAANQGTYTIMARWERDVRYTATAQATVLPAPAPATTDPNLVLASGTQQSAANGQRHAAVVGEPNAAGQATDASKHLELRHGFNPSAQ